MRALHPLAPLAFILVAACSSAPAPTAVASSRTAIDPAPSAPEPAAHASPRPAGPISDDALVEGPNSRDPFRVYAHAEKPPLPDTRPRKARRIPVDQLKLIGLVTNTATPRAMLVDPAGKGYIVTTGELVGRPEPISGEGDRTASFRVDRIRESDIVLVREDAPASTRVITLPRDPLLQADD